jgi:hypothetical protein
MPTHGVFALSEFMDYEDIHASGDAPWSRNHLRRLIKARIFPAPVVLSRDRLGRPHRIAWLTEEIIQRRARLRAERDAALAVAN